MRNAAAASRASPARADANNQTIRHALFARLGFPTVRATRMYCDARGRRSSHAAFCRPLTRRYTPPSNKSASTTVVPHALALSQP